jgi:hypothetical protein
MLAQCVYGWGRIHTIRALVPTLQERDTELLDWLVREGFHNTVGDGYLAALVVENGHLINRLSVKEIDNGLLHASGILIAALLDPNCAGPDISQVKDGLKLVKEYLRHLSANHQTHMHQPTLIRLKEILQASDETTDPFIRTLLKKGWQQDRDLRRQLALVLGDEELFMNSLDG